MLMKRLGKIFTKCKALFKIMGFGEFLRNEFQGSVVPCVCLCSTTEYRSSLTRLTYTHRYLFTSSTTAHP